MAYMGRKFVFYGSFESKADAKKTEHKHPGSFIHRTYVTGQGTRYLVLKERGK
jgi:hypothetical protein